MRATDWGRHEAHHHGHNDRKKNPHGFRDRAGMVLHMNLPLFFRRDKADREGLDDRYEGHVRVGRHRDGSDIPGTQNLGHQKGGRAICRSDDADGNRIFQIKAQSRRQKDRREDTELGSRSKKKHQRIGQQRPEIDHGADTDKKKDGREPPEASMPTLKEPFDDALGLNTTLQGLIQYP